MTKGFSKENEKHKSEYLKNLNRLCGDNEQCQTEMNLIANQSVLPIFEKRIRVAGFTLLIYVIRDFYDKFGSINMIDFCESLEGVLTQTMSGRLPEKDGGAEAIEFLKSQYGYTDLD